MHFISPKGSVSLFGISSSFPFSSCDDVLDFDETKTIIMIIIIINNFANIPTIITFLFFSKKDCFCKLNDELNSFIRIFSSSFILIDK